MKKLLCLFAVLGALVVAGCGDDDDGGGSAGSGNAGSGNAGSGNTGAAECEDSEDAFNCSKFETCCTPAPACWYNATRDGVTKRFDCSGGTQCQQAAADAIAFCE